MLQALKLLTPLVRKLGPNANPGKLKELPAKGALMWAFYAGLDPLLSYFESKYACHIHSTRSSFCPGILICCLDENRNGCAVPELSIRPADAQMRVMQATCGSYSSALHCPAYRCGRHRRRCSRKC